MLDLLATHSVHESEVRLCNYSLLNSSVHHIALNSLSHQAVLNWLECMDAIYNQSAFQKALTLTEVRLSLMPRMAFATYLSDQWLRKQFNRMRSRNAILHVDGALDLASEQILHALPGHGNNIVRFFAPQDRNDAIRWLVSDD